MKEKVLISACLLGVNCKYNGGNNLNEKIKKWQEEYELIPVCPEVWGGLTTPRNPSEILKDKVINDIGTDVTANFKRGANETLELAKRLNVKKAILKAKSPSCGKGLIYDGTFTGTKVEGYGITAKLLIENNIEIYTEEEL